MQKPAARPYRAVLIPEGTPADQVERLADLGKLPVHEVQATSAYAAKRAAQHEKGMAVLRVERHDEAAEVAA